MKVKRNIPIYSKVILPRLDDNDQMYQYRPIKERLGILRDFSMDKKDNLVTYVNRPPKWNSVVEAYVLNFYGRVDKPSVKNFQLIEEGKEDLIYL